MTQFRPCKTCWHSDIHCSLRASLRDELGFMETTPFFPRRIVLTNLNFQCDRRLHDSTGRRPVIGRRVVINLLVSVSGEDSFTVFSHRGVIVDTPREVSGKWLVYFDEDADYRLHKKAGRFHLNRLRLLDEYESVCSCGDPERVATEGFAPVCDTAHHIRCGRAREYDDEALAM